MALFCSVMFRKTSISLMTTYLVIVLLFTLPLAVTFFADTFFPDSEAAQVIAQASFTSPFAAAFNLPIDLMLSKVDQPLRPNWSFFAFVRFCSWPWNGVLMVGMAKLFAAQVANGLTAGSRGCQ